MRASTRGGEPTVAVVTLVHGRGDHLSAQHLSLARGRRVPDHYLVVAMDDPELRGSVVEGLARTVVHVPRAPDGGLPLAAARNRGTRCALAAGADVLVLLDVDCLAGDDLVRSYAAVVAGRRATVWSGPVTYLPPPPARGYPDEPAQLAHWDAPHPARPAPLPGQIEPCTDPDLFWSLSFALSGAAWERIGGFCEDYVGYGGEDTDFAHAAVAAGVDLAWVGSARAYHQHHQVSSPPVEHVDDILRNGALFRRRWGRWPMLGWLHELERLGLVRRDGADWIRGGAGPPGSTTSTPTTVPVHRHARRPAETKEQAP